jgi:NAD kinase
MNDINNRIKEFEKKQKNVVISYGGDGTLLRTFHQNPDKSILPIRDYGMCEKHAGIINDVLNGTEFSKAQFKLYLSDLLKCDNQVAISEIQMTSIDPTCCLRFDVYVNNKIYMENVISNGFIISTRLGATGYFKSVARTIFRDGYGLGFICPTYGINNLVLKSTDTIDIVFRRSCEAYLCFDHMKSSQVFNAGDKKSFRLSSDHASIFGYDEFMCPECRKGRNSTIINDQYQSI